MQLSEKLKLCKICAFEAHSTQEIDKQNEQRQRFSRRELRKMVRHLQEASDIIMMFAAYRRSLT